MLFFWILYSSKSPWEILWRTTVFNINNNKKKSWAPNQHIKIIFEGLLDIGYWSNGSRKCSFPITRIIEILMYIEIEKKSFYNIMFYICFTILLFCVFDKINTAFKKIIKNLTDSRLLNSSVYQNTIEFPIDLSLTFSSVWVNSAMRGRRKFMSRDRNISSRGECRSPHTQLSPNFCLTFRWWQKHCFETSPTLQILWNAMFCKSSIVMCSVLLSDAETGLEGCFCHLCGVC